MFNQTMVQLENAAQTIRQIYQYLTFENLAGHEKIEINTALDSIVEIVRKFQSCLDANISKKTILTEDQIQPLLNLNRQLKKISDHIAEEYKAARQQAQLRLGATNHHLFDVETEIEIDYAMRKSDPAYRDDRDNYLTAQRKIPIELISDNIDWSESYTQDTLSKDSHCYLFHDLYDHAQLGWADCLRIGIIYADITIRWQYAFNADTGKWEV